MVLFAHPGTQVPSAQTRLVLAQTRAFPDTPKRGRVISSGVESPQPFAEGASRAHRPTPPTSTQRSSEKKKQSISVVHEKIQALAPGMHSTDERHGSANRSQRCVLELHRCPRSTEKTRQSALTLQRSAHVRKDPLEPATPPLLAPLTPTPAMPPAPEPAAAAEPPAPLIAAKPPEPPLPAAPEAPSPAAPPKPPMPANPASVPEAPACPAIPPEPAASPPSAPKPPAPPPPALAPPAAPELCAPLTPLSVNAPRYPPPLPQPRTSAHARGGAAETTRRRTSFMTPHRYY